MKLIDVLIKLSKGKIKHGTILSINDRKKYRQYKYIGNCFLDEYNLPLNIYGESDLNREVELIPPTEKEYLVKFNMPVLKDVPSYLKCHDHYDDVSIGDAKVLLYQTAFTNKELQYIQEFLEDMEGKYELIEVIDMEEWEEWD